MACCGNHSKLTREQKEHPELFISCHKCGGLMPEKKEDWEATMKKAFAYSDELQAKGTKVMLLHLPFEATKINGRDFFSVQMFEAKHPERYTTAVRAPAPGAGPEWKVFGMQFRAYNDINQTHHEELMELRAFADKTIFKSM